VGQASYFDGIKFVRTYLTDDRTEDYTSSGTAISKIGKMLDAAESGQTQLELPSDMTLDDLKRWIPKAIKSLYKGNPNERFEGRTGLEEWAVPVNFATLEANMGSGGGPESLGDSRSAVSVGDMIYKEILIHGRRTKDELKADIGGVEPELLFFVFNAMLMEKYLQKYTEKDGTETFELVEAVKRDRMLGRTTKDEKPKEIEDKNYEKPHLKKDTMSKTPLYNTVSVVDTIEGLNNNLTKED
jgi:hypothetical protein